MKNSITGSSYCVRMPLRTGHNKAAQTKEQNGLEILSHPAYSPVLDPSDFFLYPNLKNHSKGAVIAVEA